MWSERCWAEQINLYGVPGARCAKVNIILGIAQTPYPNRIGSTQTGTQCDSSFYPVSPASNCAQSIVKFAGDSELLHRTRRTNIYLCMESRTEPVVCRVVAVKSKETHRTCSPKFTLSLALIRANELFVQSQNEPERDGV